VRTTHFSPPNSSMPDYRRAQVPGGTFFFTVVTEQRAGILCQGSAPALLGNIFRACLKRWPFQVDALVLLPDHLHALWTLPPGDTDYSRRWAWIKKEFSKAWLTAGGQEQNVSDSRLRHGYRGVWQRRFWEHALRDETDYARHFDYIHWNPVKHGLVGSARDWRYSTFHRWVRAGVYSSDWGSDGQTLSFSDLEESAME
jgi:putative transposase